MRRLIGFDRDKKAPDSTVILPYDQRQKSRLLVTLENDEEVGIFLPRGTILRGGDQLKTEQGFVVLVVSASEKTSTAYSKEPLLLMKASYHLGNRHVALQLGECFVRYQHDHVLDEMVAAFGLEVRHETVSFEPETGAYHSHGPKHHSHEH
ncbi:MAG TPA: urease accessory protein UreE [Methylococcales bacterium]|jgi:urease accessory protein|nr:urease accessory protein UreE [Methylococcales bacterium]